MKEAEKSPGDWKPKIVKETPPAERDRTIRMWRDDEIRPSETGFMYRTEVRQVFPLPQFVCVCDFGSNGGKSGGPILVFSLLEAGKLAPERYCVEVTDLLRLIVQNRDQLPPPEKPKPKIIPAG